MLIPDSPTYMVAISNGHPLAQMYFNYIPRLIGYEGAIALQILFCCFAETCFLVRGLRLTSGWQYLFAIPILTIPTIIWGVQIGSDALGYGLFLLALSYYKKPGVFIVFVLLASLVRFQYIALLGGLLFFPWWRCITIIIFGILSCIVMTEWRGTLGMYGRVRKTTEYLVCASKPEHMSHAEYFNISWGGHLPETEPGCADIPIQIKGNTGVMYEHRAELVQLIKSKVRYALNPLGLPAIIFSVMFEPHISVLCLFVLLFVSIFATPLYMQYTAMITAVLSAVAIKWAIKKNETP